ncbi:MAG: protein-glutamate O-methyltransferase CheR [Sedimentisphaerales bacterium]|nr:protein-glutamate O-methyltransferase CheR [Sedimentisphaerales bacterium]
MKSLTLQEVVLGEEEFRRISDLVYEHCGINLHDGKKELVRARLAKRLREGRFETFSDYLWHVLDDPTGREFSILVDSLSTNLTKFSREDQHFDYLGRRLLPRLIAAKPSRGPCRIRGWSAGCSSGEEPYSIAITLLEAVQGKGRWDVRLLATDVSTRVLERAQRGVYEKERIEPIPLPLRNKYLLRRHDGASDTYEVGPALRDLVIFRYLNLMKDWPIKGPLDFIFCRNVMIYFDKSTQGRLISRFYDLLGPGGVLFTGHSESLTGIEHKFQYVQPTIYTKQ